MLRKLEVRRIAEDGKSSNCRNGFRGFSYSSSSKKQVAVAAAEIEEEEERMRALEVA